MEFVIMYVYQLLKCLDMSMIAHILILHTINCSIQETSGMKYKKWQN